MVEGPFASLHRHTVSNIPTGFQTQLTSLAGGMNGWRLTRWASLLPKIAALEPELQKLGDDQLRKRSLSLQYRAKSGEPLTRLLVEGYALVREAGRRSINMRHFDVQILGGIAMFHRSIVEMQTGEGKTLTATLPLYLHALMGRGAHLATVNDYLARRDADWMRPIYQLLGLSVGVVETQMAQPERRKAYACDITYGTAKEFGFDFLRDRLLLRRIAEGQTDVLGGMLGQGHGGGDEKPVQRDAHFALVDEADSILIDEARTPLIISALPTEEEKLAVECYRWSASVIKEFVEDDDYEYEHEKKKAELTREGRQKVRLMPKPPALDTVGMVNIYQYIEQAIVVDREYFLERQYVVRDGEIVIVDEFTGRLAEGRKWRDGVHQAVEAKQGVEVTVATGQAARITVQDFFLRYKNLAGMTGTAMGSARELRRIYRCHVMPIPTNKPAIRERMPTCVFGDADTKWAAIVEEVCQMHAAGRPLLIGTRSIDKSELLSKLLAEKGIEHQVLNANHVAEEADIIARRRIARQGDGFDEHGRPRHRHQAGRGRAGSWRAARDLHRDARRQPHRPPVDRALRPAGRPRHLPPVSCLGRRSGAGRARAGEVGQVRRISARNRPARSTISPGCSARRRRRSSVATSASARR